MVKFKFKFLNWNTIKDTLLDPDINDINDKNDVNHFVPSDKIVKFKSLTGEINKLDCRGEIGHSNEIVENNTMKLIWGYLTATMNIGRSGEIVFDEIVVKFKFNAMKLIVNKSVVLSWVYLQPFLTDTAMKLMEK